MTTNPFTNANMGNLAAQVAHDPGGAARMLRDLETEVERLRAALNAVHNILRAEPTGGLPFGVRLTLESLARFALDAPSGSSDAPVSGFGGSQEAGT